MPCSRVSLKSMLFSIASTSCSTMPMNGLSRFSPSENNIAISMIPMVVGILRKR